MKISGINTNVQAVNTSAKIEKVQKLENKEAVAKTSTVAKDTSKIQKNSHGDTFERSSAKVENATYNKSGKVSTPVQLNTVEQSKKSEHSHMSQNIAIQTSMNTSVHTQKSIASQTKVESTSKIQSISKSQGLDVRA